VDYDLAMKMALGEMNSFAMITFNLKKRLLRDLFFKDYPCIYEEEKRLDPD